MAHPTPDTTGKVTTSAAPLFLSSAASFALTPGQGTGTNTTGTDTSAAPSLPRQFSGQLYSGGPVMGSVYVDVASVSVEPHVPVLLQHDPAKVIGKFSSIQKTDHALTVSGVLFTDIDADAAAIVKKAQAGIQWQMSLGGYDYSTEDVPAGKAFQVNGMALTGPATVLRGLVLREGSIVALGADKHTSAAFFAAPSVTPSATCSPTPRATTPTTLEKEGAHMPTQAEFDQLKTQADALTAENAALKAEGAALKAAAHAAAVQQRTADVQALFAATGRTFAPGDDAPYQDLPAATFAALSADLSARFAATSLPGHLTHSAFSAATAAHGNAPQDDLVASMRRMHGLPPAK